MRWIAPAALALGLMCGESAIFAYEIGSQSRVKQTWDLHETMTALASECSKKGTIDPSNCIAGWAQSDHPLFQKAVKSQTAKTSALEDASRWSDDPSRQLDRAPSSVHWGASMWTACKRIMTGANFIDNVGLACSSHFGRLQFWHAMTSEAGETPEQTRRKILDWARFAYRAATEQDFRQASYCATVSQLEEGDQIKRALTFSDDSFCKDRRGNLGARYPAWRVATLFGLSCKSAVTTRAGCRDLSVGDDEKARVAAIGALLHLVQDSYSQAHVRRRNPGQAALTNSGPFESRIVCRPAEHFYDYAAQKAAGDHVHAAADQRPTIDPSCLSAARTIDDAITASAKILWFTAARDQDRTPDLFVDYLAKNVFPAS